jgi:hypothetical protein
MKYFFLILLIPIIFFSCKKDEEIAVDENFTREEIFSFNIANGLLQLDDEDLQEYLQTEVYPLVSASQKVFANRESSTEFSIFYEGEGKMNIITIRKFYDAVGESIFFEMSEPEVLNIDEN